MEKARKHNSITLQSALAVAALVLALAWIGAPQAYADLVAGDAGADQLVIGSMGTQDSTTEGTTGNCTWNLSSEGVLTFSPVDGTDGSLGSLISLPGLDKADVTKVVFEQGVKAEGKVLELAFASSNVWTSLKSVDASKLDVSEATSFRHMFAYCPNLETVNVQSWDTSNVEDMTSMFMNCSKLTELDVSNWNTSKVLCMQEMFSGCSSLTEIDVSRWNTSSISPIGLGDDGYGNPYYHSFVKMFSGCKSLQTLDVSNWDTSNATHLNYMFNGCSNLESLDVSQWDTGNVKNMLCLFNGCSKLTEIDVSNWNTANVTGFYSVFGGCSSLASLNLSNWNTAKGESFAYMFKGCSSLKSLDVASFNTKNAYNMTDMFADCASLETIVLGTDFSFQCDESRGSAETSLVGSTDPKYSEAWSGPGGTFTSADFTSRYSGDTMAGTYVKMPTIAGASVSGITNRTYTGKAQTQSAKLALGGAALAEGTDYAVSYRNNENAGTATVTFTGKGGYAGSLSKTFKISPAPISKAKLALAYTAKTYTGTALKPALKTASFNGAALKKGTDYSLAYKANKAVGTATVTVKGLGNFAGSKKLTFTVRMPKPTVSLAAHAGKLTSGQKGIDVSWKMKPMPPAAQVTGYVVQFSTSKAFPSGKTRTSAVTITASNKYKALYAKRTAVATGGTHFKMRANTVYYVRVKAYRKLGGKTYATWSAAAKCRTSK